MKKGMAQAVPLFFYYYLWTLIEMQGIMKTIRLIAAAAALVLVSCTAKPGDVTKITGIVNDSTVTDVRVTLASQKVDTTVAVVDGRFYVEVPADVASYGMIMDTGRRFGTYYISDGTEVEISFSEDGVEMKAEPEYVASRYAEYMDAVSAIYEADAATADASLAALCLETVKANPDNAVALLAIADAMYSMQPEQMLEVLALVQDPVRQDRFIVSREKEANAQLNTKPGMKYTDFTVNTVTGYTRSMDPQPIYKEVRFSDYVGKGTYVLVDFWAPWCGPCRREIPNIKKVYEQYKDKGLEVLSIAVWENQPQSVTIEAAGNLGMDWLHINNAQAVPTDIYGIGGIPHLMLIGPDGTILARGFHGLEGITAAVEEHIR